MPGRPPFNSRGLIYARAASLQLPQPDPHSGGCPSLPPTGSTVCPPLLATTPPSTRGGLREDPRQWGLPFLSPRPDPRHALHCWQRYLHRLMAGYGKYWGCVPWRKPHIASPAYLHRSPPRLPLRPFPEARNTHL